jgi:hypothetical protein
MTSNWEQLIHRFAAMMKMGQFSDEYQAHEENKLFRQVLMGST